MSTLTDQQRLRFGLAMAGANLAGALVVFIFLFFVLPAPRVPHPDTLRIINAVAFVVFGLVSFPTAWVWSTRRTRATLGWEQAGRTPTDRERRMTLRLPLTQQAIVGAIWASAAIVFAALNAPSSGTLAVNVAITIVLGGLVTCALGYLLAERLLRSLTARALSDGVPARPELPGVRARALLSWTLGTGAVLLGITLVAIGGLRGQGFTLERLSIAVLVLSAIGMVVGLVAIDGLARSVADRIEALRRAIGLVEQGRLDHEVEVDDGSEIGLLQAGFNRMLVGLRERERMRDLFGRQVGEDVVRLALGREEVELGGEAREAAVLFVDLEGSTTLAERRDPAEVVALLNAFFAIVVEVVAAHGGWVNKFEGDAALCVFGAPLPDPAAAAQALTAGRELRERIRTELPEINAGIGVSAGRVVAGNIGAAKRFEYTVIGDPVNQAARLTELAKGRSEGVLASDEALARAGEEAKRWQVCEEVSLRGRSRATKVAVPRG